MTTVRISVVRDFAALGQRWRDLERRAAGSFFQSWTWVGCLVEERFTDPILIAATEDGRTVALALFNRTRRRIGPSVLHLGESGAAELDCPYVEQNGVLAEAGREDALTELCLRVGMRSHDVVLSGIGEREARVVRRQGALVLVRQSQASPFVDLAGVRARGGDYLAERSANTRQQIRRSKRHYERAGPMVVERADTIAAAHVMLDEMAALHQAAWTARGQPGCFARPFFQRFHRALIETAMPRGEVALVKVVGDGNTVGILYNFVHGGRMSAYQSGFAYSEHEPRAKPGLISHCLAIQLALEHGVEIYDFLAGESRYKLSLADGSHRQMWARAGRLWSPRLLLGCGLRRVREMMPPTQRSTEVVSGGRDRHPGAKEHVSYQR